jgi:uncharacterized protein with HEPN domain
MAPSKNPTARLRHILDEVVAIQAATAEIDLETFRDTWTIHRAVEHGLLIIAEASKSLPTELKTRQPAIPWARVEALGNVLRHEYQDVDPKVLWRIVREQLPVLADMVRQELDQSDH